MKTVVKILAGLLVLVLLVVVAAFVVVESKYHALLASPVIALESIADPNASIRVSVRPPMALDLIRPKLEAQGVPSWATAKVLPYEAGVFLTPQLEGGRFGLRVSLNEQRLGPVIATAPAQMNLTGLYPFVQWTSDVMTFPRRGELTLDAVVEAPPLGIQAIEKYWGQVFGLKRPAFEGGHLAEAVIDNRDGSLFAFLATLDANNAPRIGLPLDDLAKTLLPIAVLRVKSDLESPDSLRISFIVDCRPESEETQVSTTDFQLGMALGAVAKQLQDQHGVSLKGTRRRDGVSILGEYTLSGFQKLL